jgi:predicted O-methyltransferase YrrM
MHQHHELAMLTQEEKYCLFNVVKQLSPGAVALEVGTHKGGSCSIMASANSRIKIHTLDLFEDQNSYSYIDVADRLFSFNNVTVYKGNSFENFKNWDMPIDLYFEDGAHENPALMYSMLQWIPHLKVDGYMLVHDNNDHFPDVGKNIEMLINKGEFKFVDQVNSLTVLKKVK